MTDEQILTAYINELQKYFTIEASWQSNQKKQDSGTQSFWIQNQIECSKTIRKSIKLKDRKPSKKSLRVLNDIH